jgi:hypothetical protein
VCVCGVLLERDALPVDLFDWNTLAHRVCVRCATRKGCFTSGPVRLKHAGNPSAKK